MDVNQDPNRLVNVLKSFIEMDSYNDDMVFVIQHSTPLNIGTDILYVGNIRKLLEEDDHVGLNYYTYRYFQAYSGWNGCEYKLLTVDFEKQQ